MTHGDDKGLRVPPRLAPTGGDRAHLEDRRGQGARARGGARRLKQSLGEWELARADRLRIHLDARDSMKPGRQVLRVGAARRAAAARARPAGPGDGPGDARAPRTGGKKTPSARALGGGRSRPCWRRCRTRCSGPRASGARRTAIRGAHHVRASSWRSWMATGGFVYAGWCGDAACETAIKEETKATIRVPAGSGVPLAEARQDLPQVRQAARSTRRCGRRRTDAAGFVRTRRRARPARACRWMPIAAAAGTPGVRVQRGRDPRRVRRARSRARAGAAPHALQREGELQPRVLRVLRELGAGVDIVSGGELFARRARASPARTSCSAAWGRPAAELREALAAGVLMVNVESESELRAAGPTSRASCGTMAPIALRVNPEVNADTPTSYIAHGRARQQVRHPVRPRPPRRPARALAQADIALCSVSTCTLARSSPISSPTARASCGCSSCTVSSASAGARRHPLLRHWRRPGGDVRRRGADGRAVLRGGRAAARGASGLTLLVEPGRFLVGNAGRAPRARARAQTQRRQEYVIIDAGMNDLLRPSHYNAFHHVEAVRPRDGRSRPMSWAPCARAAISWRWSGTCRTWRKATSWRSAPRARTAS